MKRKLYTTIAILSFVVVIATINVKLAKIESSPSSLTLERLDLLALGESFFFDGTEWNDADTHWFGSDWKPVLVNCAGSSTRGSVTSYWTGKMVQCQYGNGNCANGTSCIGDPAN
jgi:hypothetical protein